jgi:hypothetical protein
VSYKNDPPTRNEPLARKIDPSDGKGLGYIDVHLSASALLTGVPMWSYDKRLNEANELLGIKYDPALIAEEVRA